MKKAANAFILRSGFGKRMSDAMKAPMMMTAGKIKIKSISK